MSHGTRLSNLPQSKAQYVPNPDIQPPLEFPYPDPLHLEGATEADLYSVIEQLAERMGALITEANAEIQLMHKQLLGLDEENFNCVTALEELRSQQTDISVYQQELEIANAMIAEKDTLISELEQHITDLNGTIELQGNTIQDQENEFQNITNQKDALIEEHEKKIASLQQSLADAEKKSTSLEDSLKSSAVSKVSSDEDQKKISTLEKSLSSSEQKVASLESSLKSYEQKASNLEKSLSVSEEKVVSLEKSLASAEKARIDSEQALASAKQASVPKAEQSSTAEVNQLKRDLEAATSKCRLMITFEDDNKALREKLDSQLEQYQDLQQKMQQLQASQQDLGSSGSDQRLQQLEEEMIDAQTELVTKAQEIQELQAQIQQLQAQLTDLKKKPMPPPKPLPAAGNSAEVGQLQAQLKTLQAKLTEVNEKYQETNQILQETQIQVEDQESEIESLKQQLEQGGSGPAPTGGPNTSQMSHQIEELKTKHSIEIEKYKKVVTMLQQQAQGGDAKRKPDLGNHRGATTTPAKDQQLKEQADEINYLKSQCEALNQTVQEMMLGTSGGVAAKAQMGELNKYLEAKDRQLKAAEMEKQILEKKILHMQNDMKNIADGSGGNTAQLSIRIRQLETEKEQTDLKLKRLVSAVKVDRDAKEQELSRVKQEREIAEKKADELENKLISLIDLLEQEKEKKKGAPSNEALEAARVAMKHAEEQILSANLAAQQAEQAVAKREEDLEKLKLALQKKMRENHTVSDELNQLTAKFERLLAATKVLKLENNKLQQQGRSTMMVQDGSVDKDREIETLSEKVEKMEGFCKKLKAMLDEAKAEAADKESSYQTKLKSLEQRLKNAEERARNAQVDSLSSAAPPPPPPAAGGPIMKRGGPPPPPPPGARGGPKVQGATTIKIKKSGQSDGIQGPKGKPPPAAAGMGDIVEAIRSGAFQLRKIERPSEEKKPINNPNQGLAMMAQQVMLEKKKREQQKLERERAEAAKKEVQQNKKGELDNLLVEFGEMTLM